MKWDMKIMLPPYKLIYPVLFMLLLAFVRGVSDTREIGTVLDSMIPVLAIVFMADTYQIEYSEQRWEIFELYDMKRKRQMIYRRIGIQMLYLFCSLVLGYGFFFIQNPMRQSSGMELKLYFTFLLAGVVTISFFGVLSLTITNLLHNMWAGVGISFISWLSLNSTVGNKILGTFNVLAYGFRKIEDFNNYSWGIGKMIALACTVLMLIMLPLTMKNRR